MSKMLIDIEIKKYNSTLGSTKTGLLIENINLLPEMNIVFLSEKWRNTSFQNRRMCFENSRYMCFENTFSLHIFAYGINQNNESINAINKLLLDFNDEKWYAFYQKFQNRETREKFSSDLLFFIAPDGAHETIPGIFFKPDNYPLIQNLLASMEKHSTLIETSSYEFF
jgi:hypothetical protein